MPITEAILVAIRGTDPVRAAIELSALARGGDR